jgi:hypothetical protein
MKNNDRSRSSQMSLGSPMEIDYSIDVGNIEVLISKVKYNDNDEERSGKKKNLYNNYFQFGIVEQ